MKSLEQQLHETHARINDLESSTVRLREELSRKIDKNKKSSRTQPVDLVESFKQLGLTEEEAEIAQAGRPRSGPLLSR